MKAELIRDENDKIIWDIRPDFDDPTDRIQCFMTTCRPTEEEEETLLATILVDAFKVDTEEDMWDVFNFLPLTFVDKNWNCYYTSDVTYYSEKTAKEIQERASRIVNLAMQMVEIKKATPKLTEEDLL